MTATESTLVDQSLTLLNQKTFIITVNDKEYECNYFGVNSSKIIREQREKDPSLTKYSYEYEGKSEDFQPICNLFNFKQINISTKNMKSLLQIAEDLQITSIIDKLYNFNEKFDLIIQQNEVVDDILQKLTKINQQTVESVKESILDSIWIQSEEGIQELVSIICQVASNNLKIQPYLIELITSLHQSATKKNNLHMFMQYLVKHVLNTFYSSKNLCSFANKMTKKNFLTVSDLVNSDSFSKSDNLFQESYNKNVSIFFFPELIEIKHCTKDSITSKLDKKDAQFIKKYLPKDIEKFKELRDSDEPDNEISRAIYNDDIESLKTIMTKNKISYNSNVDYYFMDQFENNIEKSLINYSCECGSLKCFKYLLLNHAFLDNLSLGFAIFGNNSEIIHTVEQEFKIGQKIIKDSNDFTNMLMNPIIITLKHNNYDLFDWLIEKNLKIDYDKIIVHTISSGNIYSFIRLLDTGIKLSDFSNITLTDWIIITASKGFYHFTKLLFSLIDCNKLKPKLIDKEIRSIGLSNISIFKLFYPTKDEKVKYNTILPIAIEKDYYKVVQYIIEELYCPTASDDIYEAFSKACGLSSPKIFNYLDTKIDINSCFFSSNFFVLLEKSCAVKNFDAAKKVTDLILEKVPNSDLSSEFIIAAKKGFVEMCQYFIEKNAKIDVYQVLENYHLIDLSIGECLFKLINNVESNEKDLLYNAFRENAVKNGNKTLFKLLNTKNFVLNKYSLIDAVKNDDLELVNMVLDNNSKLSFINQTSIEGSALNIAAKNNNLPIFKRLLSIPGINTNLRDKNNLSPLLIATKNLNYEMIYLILDLYGDKIHTKVYQINESLKLILENMIVNKTKINNELIKRLIQIENVDLNFYIKNDTFLTFAVINNDFELVKILVESNKVDVNMYELVNQDSPLLISTKNNYNQISKLLISNPNTDINYTNGKSETALINTVKNQEIEIINLLINDERFNADDSNVNYAFYISDYSIPKILSTIKGFDANYSLSLNNESKSFDSSKGIVFNNNFSNAIKQKNSEKIKIIIDHPTFNQTKMDSKFIFKQVFMQDYDLFIKIVQKFNIDINEKSLIDGSLLIFAAKYGNDKVIKYILDDKSFKTDSLDFITAFNVIKRRPQLAKSVDYMIDYDIKHSHFMKDEDVAKNNSSICSGWGNISQSLSSGHNGWGSSTNDDNKRKFNGWGSAININKT